MSDASGAATLLDTDDIAGVAQSERADFDELIPNDDEGDDWGDLEEGEIVDVTVPDPSAEED